MPAKLAFSGLLLAVIACASAPAPKDWRNVTVVERNREGEVHLALPTELPGCKHLGMTRISIPEGASAPPEILDSLKQKAAKMGGNTLVLLPGKRVILNSLRGSVFQCETPPTP